jgi:hypothetical protein
MLPALLGILRERAWPRISAETPELPTKPDNESPAAPRGEGARTIAESDYTLPLQGP